MDGGKKEKQKYVERVESTYGWPHSAPPSLIKRKRRKIYSLLFLTYFLHEIEAPWSALF
jgi:hypothetical protein